MLDKLVEEQEITNEQILLLRQEMRTFTRELQRERLQMIEFLRERADTAPKEEPSAEGSKSTDKEKETEGRLSLKNILLTVAGVGAALYALKDQLPTELKSALKDAFKNFLFPGRDSDTDPDTVLSDSPTDELLGVTAIKKAGPRLVTGGTNYVLRSAGNTVTETLQEIGTRPTASKAATAAAQLATETIPNNRIAQAIAAKVAATGGALTAKSVPLMGSGVALYFAGDRIKKGDYTGAAIEAFAAVPYFGTYAATAASVTRDVYTQIYGITPEEDYFIDANRAEERLIGIGDQVLSAIKNHMESQEFSRKKGIKSKIDLLESQPIGLLAPEQRSELQALKSELSMYPAAQIPMPLSQQGAEELYGSTFVDAVRGGDFVDQLLDPTSSTRMDLDPTSSTRMEVSDVVGKETSSAVSDSAGAKVIAVDSSQNSQTTVTGAVGGREREITMSPEIDNASTISAYASGK